MKIFFLDTDPKKSAECLIDKHLGPQGVYLCQLLSAAHRTIDGIREERPSKVPNKIEHRYALPEPLQTKLYASGFTKGYPAADFVKQSTGHYYWAYDYLTAVMREYFKRYNHPHDHNDLVEMLKLAPKKMFTQSLEDGWLFMPSVDIELKYTTRDEDGVIDLVQTYRNWYKFAQPGVMRWTKTETPTWYN
jgi:Pyrimidine dimer DNA glycosylase